MSGFAENQSLTLLTLVWSYTDLAIRMYICEDT